MNQQELLLILFQVIVLVLAFSVHESAHAYIAMRLGDPTAYMLGRVTLNPMKHLDPWGSVVIPALSFYFGGFLIGWAKPCPITLRNFKNVRRDDILTSLAGPASNLAMASVALIGLLIFKHAGGGNSILAAMLTASHVPGIDASGLPLFPLALLLYYGVTLNLLLFVFNLFPIPPLDGSHVLANFLPYEWEQAYTRYGMWGWAVFFLLGGRFLAAFYDPLLGIFNHVLAAL